MNVSGKVEGCDSIIRFYFISKHYNEDDGVKNNLKESVFSLHNGLPNSVFETGVSIAPGARKSIHAYAPYMLYSSENPFHLKFPCSELKTLERTKLLSKLNHTPLYTASLYYSFNYS